MGVAEHRDADHLDADGVQGAAAGALTAVDGVDELAHLGLAGLGTDEPESLAHRVEDGQGPVGAEGAAADDLVAQAAELAQRSPQLRRQAQSVRPVAVDGQDADLGGQIRQVGRVCGGVAVREEGAQSLGRAAVTQGAAEVALQMGREDTEESSKGKIAIIEFHEAQIAQVGNRLGRCRRTATTRRNEAETRRPRRPTTWSGAAEASTASP